jgi:hypothetical protein
MERIDAWYAVRDGTDRGYELADQMLRSDPKLAEAMDFKSQYVMGDETLFKYYGSIGAIEGFFRGQMNRAIENELGAEIWETADGYYDALPGRERNIYLGDHPEMRRYFEIRKQWYPVIDDAIVRFGSKLKDIPIDTREGAGGTVGQESVLSGIEGQNRGLPQLGWQEWQGILGESLSRLILDYSLRGEELPYSANGRLDDIADQMGLPSGEVLLQLAAQAAAP